MTGARETTDETGDVVDFLLDQHQQIRTLLTDVLERSGPQRQRTFDEARELLARHETGEEMVLRPLTRKAADGGPVADARFAEENEAKEVLARLERMDVDTAEFESTFRAFRHSVLEHAEAEERDEFPLLRRDHDAATLTKARDRLQRAEKMAPTHPHPSARTTTANYVAGPFAAMLDRARDAFSRS
jgi:hemerythrin superfamily protein